MIGQILHELPVRTNTLFPHRHIALHRCIVLRDKLYGLQLLRLHICTNCSQITTSFVYLTCDSARNYISLALSHICTYLTFTLQDCSYFAKLFFSRTGLFVQMYTLFARIGKAVKMGNTQSLLHVKVHGAMPYYRFYLQVLYKLYL